MKAKKEVLAEVAKKAASGMAVQTDA